jgi:Ca-activated chloride channel family protein
MEFSNYKILWHILWIAPLAVFILKRSRFLREKGMSAMLGERKNSNQFNTLSKTRRGLRTALLTTAFLLAMIAAARPLWGKKIVPFTSSGRDIMLVADVSKSMLADDIKPSRMDHSKWFLKQIILSCPSDRFGVAAFSGSAFLECPLTVDKTTLNQAIDELKPGYIPLGGTNIQNAMETAREAFRAAESGNRAIILISDGDELQGDSASVLKKLKESNIPVFVVGIGNPFQKTPISIKDEYNKNLFLRNSQGEIVQSSLNEALLKKIAVETNGIYVRSTTTDPGLEPIIDRAKKLVPEKYSSGNNTRPIERFQIPLAAAILLLMIRLAIGERAKPSALLPALLIVISPQSGSADENQPADSEKIVSQSGQEMKESPEKSSEMDALKKENPSEIFNKGLEKQSEENFDEAAQLYSMAAGNSKSDAETKKRAFQNLGVIEHLKGRETIQKDPKKSLEFFSTAEEMYKESMRAENDKGDISSNQQILLNDIEKAKKIIEEQKKEQQAKQNAKKEIEKAGKENKDASEKPQDNKEKDEAKSQAEKAQKAVDEYKKQSEKNQNNAGKEKADKVKDELEKASSEQKKDNFDAAQKYIDNALRELSDKDEKQKNENEEKTPSNGDKKDNQAPEKESQPKPLPPPQGEKKDDKNIDPAQAAALLDLMAKDEKNLRDELKRRMNENSRIKDVEKDW